MHLLDSACTPMSSGWAKKKSRGAITSSITINDCWHDPTYLTAFKDINPFIATNRMRLNQLNRLDHYITKLACFPINPIAQSSSIVKMTQFGYKLVYSQFGETHYVVINKIIHVYLLVTWPIVGVKFSTTTCIKNWLDEDFDPGLN